VVGDPLDPLTQVGYVDARCLDWLAELRKKNSLRATFYGGERLSPQQATPLLVASQEELPDFFAQEIPAYVLAVSEVENLPEAIRRINHYTGDEPRLAVSLFNFPKEALSRAMLDARAHTVLVNTPTSTLLPAFHEGNDYALLLRQARMIGF
jgi:acyl-CoA reductase-like NAD-dependent aldehyde dehydrogenase